MKKHRPYKPSLIQKGVMMSKKKGWIQLELQPGPADLLAQIVSKAAHEMYSPGMSNMQEDWLKGIKEQLDHQIAEFKKSE